MALDFNKIEEPDDSVFPVKLEDGSNLDMYGVWVKKRPENKDSDESVLPVENDIAEFDDHDVINLDSSDETLEFEELTTLNNFETIDAGDSLDDLSIISDDADFSDDPQETKTYGEDMYGDEFDIFDEPDAVVLDEETKDSFKEDIDEMPKAEDETVSNINDFETLDLDDFLSDDETIEAVSKKEPENKDESGSFESDNIKLDLSFDEDYLETKGSDAIDFEGNESFEIPADELDTHEAKGRTSEIDNLPERKIEDIADFDEILDELEANDGTDKETAEDLTDDIPLSITIDEYSDITSLAGKTMGSDDDLEDVEIFGDISEFEKAEEILDDKEQEEDDGLVIESTIIEAGNIDEIRKENQKIMANSSPEEAEKEPEIVDDFDSMLDSVMGEPLESEKEEEPIEEKSDMFFDDIEAFENDLLDSESYEVPEEFTEAATEIQTHKKTDEVQPAAQSTVLANDKATEILMQIASELVNIKNELANMKFEMAQTQQKLEEVNIVEAQENKVTDTILNEVTESDKTGFFNDDDGDETIALTGDELNNILITADFTEENTEKDYEIPETLDEIDGAFLDDDNMEEDTSEDEPEVFADEDLLNAVEPEHINDLTDDLSYLDEDLELSEDEPDEETEEIIQVEDFLSDEIKEEPVLEEVSDEAALEDNDTEQAGGIDGFDLKITELELPDGQSIPLGDEYSDFEAITENIEEGHDEAADFEDIGFEEAIEQEDIQKTDDTETDEIFEDVSVSEDISEIGNISESKEILETESISESQDMSQAITENHEDAVFSPEELDLAAQDIPRLELDESAAEEQKVQTDTLPIHLKDEIKSVLTYMDQLLESLPEEKIEEFAKSEYFDTYKRLFDELGIS